MNTHRHPWLTRITDRRYIASAAALGVAIALVLFGISTVTGDRAQRSLIADKADQVHTLRVQRDEANHRADDANDRADAVTRVALAGIRDLRCATYRQAKNAAVFSRLVFASPNATDDQRKLVAPFVRPPPKPKGCG